MPVSIMDSESSHSQGRQKKKSQQTQLLPHHDDLNSSSDVKFSNFSLLPCRTVATCEGGGLNRTDIPLAHGENVVGRLPVGEGVVGCNKLRRDLGIPADAKGVHDKHVILQTSNVPAGTVLLRAFGTVRIQGRPVSNRSGQTPTKPAKNTTPTENEVQKGAASYFAATATTASAPVVAIRSPMKSPPPRIVRPRDQCYLVVGETLELDAKNAEPAYSYILTSCTTPIPRSSSMQMSPGIVGGGGGAHWLVRSKGNKRPRNPLAAIDLESLQSAMFSVSSEPQPAQERLGGRRAPMEIKSTPPRAVSMLGSQHRREGTKRRLHLGSAWQGADPLTVKPTIVVLDDSDEETNSPAGQQSRLNEPSRTARGTAAAAAAPSGARAVDSRHSCLHKRRRDRSRSRSSDNIPFKPSMLVDLTSDYGTKGLPVGACSVQPLDLCGSDGEDPGGASGSGGKGPAATQMAAAALSERPESQSEKIIGWTSSPAPPMPSMTLEPNAATLSSKYLETPLTQSVLEDSVDVEEKEDLRTKRVETKQMIEMPITVDSLTTTKKEKSAGATDIFPSARRQHTELQSNGPVVHADWHRSLLVPTAAIPLKNIMTTMVNKCDFQTKLPVVSRRSRYGPAATALFPLAASSNWKHVNPSLHSTVVSMVGHDPYDSLLVIEQLLAWEKAPSNAMCEAVVSALLYSRSSARTQCLQRQLQAMLTASPECWRPPTNGPSWFEGVMVGLTTNVIRGDAYSGQPPSPEKLEAHVIVLELVIKFLVESCRRHHHCRSRPGAAGKGDREQASPAAAAAAVIVSGTSHVDTLSQLFDWTPPERTTKASLEVRAAAAARRAVKRCTAWAVESNRGYSSLVPAECSKNGDAAACFPRCNNGGRELGQEEREIKKLSIQSEGDVDALSKAQAAAGILTARLLAEVVETCGLPTATACEMIRDEMMNCYSSRRNGGSDSSATAAMGSSSWFGCRPDAAAGRVLEAAACCNLVRALAGRGFTVTLTRLLLAEMQKGGVVVGGAEDKRRLQLLLMRQADDGGGVGLVERFAVLRF